MVNERGSDEGQSTAVTDTANPFSLHHFDHPGMVLVSKPLNGDNYSTWSRAMTISLNAKSKLGFIDGTIEQPKEESSAWRIGGPVNPS